MDKMRMESIDMTAQNIEKIGALFPNCITETKDADGKPKKAINFDLLRQMLSGDVINHITRQHLPQQVEVNGFLRLAISILRLCNAVRE